MMAMETTTSRPTPAELAGVNVEYGKLAPLNPDDLKAPEPAPSSAHLSRHSEALSIKEVYDEAKQKLHKTIIESSVSGVLFSMRITNLIIATLMLIISVALMITEKSFWSAVSNVFSVFYTIMFALILIAYEMRTDDLDLKLRDSFGFMYGPWGRCLFLCLISVFPSGMLGKYGILVSLCGFTNAYFNYYVITKHPSFTRGVPDYVPPESNAEQKASDTEENENQ